MQGRDLFLNELLEKLDDIIDSIEEREMIEDDFSITRELAEQLRDEVQSLQ